MARSSKFNPLKVCLQSRSVGLIKKERNGAIHFAYDAAWLNRDDALPVSVSLPLREDRYSGDVVTAVFENLLPDQQSVRNRVAERVGADGTDPYSLLSMIGRDCVGAFQFIPADEELDTNTGIDGREISVEEIGVKLDNLRATPLGITKDNGFRISLAGAQEKTALLFHGGKWLEPLGTTPTTHIIKPQIGRLSNGMDLSNSVENEYLCLKLIEAFGIETAKAEIEKFGKHKALVVERFDRKWLPTNELIRVHQEDCCQALSYPSTLKYQSDGGPGILEIMDLLVGSDVPIEDKKTFYKVQVLFWLIGATDGHAKNFSIKLSSQGRFELTPIYDVLTVQPTVDKKQIQRNEYRLAMRVGKSNHYKVNDIHGRHFIETGLEAGLSRSSMLIILQEIGEQADRVMTELFDSLPPDFPTDLIDSLTKAIKMRLPRLHT